MSLFCKHDPELLSETTTKSGLELMKEVLPEAIKFKGDHRLTFRKHIQVFVCKKCGQLTRYVENI